jgi:hypothetical protein
MKKIKKMTKTQLLKIKIGATRKSQINQGFFDGRFVERSETSKRFTVEKK